MPIINQNQINLDPRLAVFTVNGTTEPRVVRLFPTTTCSCPAKANCYHVQAAKMAVGYMTDARKQTMMMMMILMMTMH